jgi:signal transduction histidine kinase
VIEVSDQGVGIAEKDLPLLFERFSRAVASRARKAEGFGMGLFIVKQLVDAHGGKVSVTSVPGEGSTFTVKLPR